MSGKEVVQWKCSECWAVNKISNQNCEKCGKQIPKEYEQYKLDENQQNNEQEQKGEDKNLENKDIQNELIINKEQVQTDIKQETQNEQDDAKDITPDQAAGKNENNDEKIHEEQKDDQNQDSESEQENEKERNLEESMKIKQLGTEEFKKSNWQIAMEYYEDAVQVSPLDEKKHLSILYSNIAICQIKMLKYQEAIINCSQSIEQDKEYRKPYLNRAIAYEHTNKEEEALDDLIAVQKMAPDDKQIQQQIYRMEKKVQEVQEKRKKEVFSGLKDLGNTILGKFGMSLDNFKLDKNSNGGYNINFNK